MPHRTRHPIRMLNLGATDWLQTQAVYHAVAESMRADSPDTIILCHPTSPYLCLGYHQVYDAVFDRAECERRGLPVVRRRVGGGATYLDADQLFYQCVFHRNRVPVQFKEVFARALAAPVKTLHRLKLPTKLHGLNEIEVGGVRVAGTGGGQIGEASVVIGNLLFDFDYDAMLSVWRLPSRPFRQLASTALRECVTTLRRLAGPVSRRAVNTMLIGDFARAFGRPLEEGRLTANEHRLSREIGERLSSPAFLDLHNRNGATAPVKSLKISARAAIRAEEAVLSGHRIRASFWLRDGTIESAILESEPARSWGGIEAKLRGLPFEAWRRKLIEELKNGQQTEGILAGPLPAAAVQ